MKTWLMVCVLLTCLIACTACTSQTVATPSPNDLPTETSTPKPSAAPTRRPSRTPTSTISPATISARKTLFAAPVTSCYNQLSPDGGWTIRTCDDEKTPTKVLRNDGSVSWEVPFYETYGTFYDIHDGVMDLRHWSKDNQFAYFVPYFCCLDAPGDDFFNYLRIGPALYRLDLNSGKITPTLPPDPTNIFSGYSLSFSHNDKYLVYDGPNGALSLYELKTGEIEEINLGEEYIYYGGYNWSADSKKLAFLAFHRISTNQYTHSYFVMNISDLAPTLLTERTEIYDFSWTAPEQLTLFGDETLTFDLSGISTP